ncbi:hypothetical protein PC129_g10621 [Phytophthora cactorum]|uniref:Uncharacterized protein n=1 Tax=Phytophthora cactorum TaxID=29920 RepID=A0A329S1P9_9STRA|nr:hypothetical protein Pcac1_g20840 [Phytophthora cactorum]KAG2819325.1 hypothetical protein PC112_g12229 [Phytophthora cactorum]KAG2821279.1 hypothetical protein PC111_g11082 [Phytophthora cactorum]KAG2855105.1 hypothetical protein PC113_g12723 [Phytophthora cactorum]KAG2901025.1 hypothetical protein PC114_g13340 [Phytophthora cactorum]
MTRRSLRPTAGRPGDCAHRPVKKTKCNAVVADDTPSPAAENPADIAEGEVRDTCGPFRGVFDSWDDGFGVQQIPTLYIPSL